MIRFEVPVIVGTGPSGVACADALIANGIRPVMLDGGNLPEREALTRSRLRGEGSVADRGDVRTTGNGNDHELKTWFGSDFATRGHAGAGIQYDEHLSCRASYAVGGLSRIWGGTFAFFRGLSSWPLEIRPTATDLAAVRSLVPSSLTVPIGIRTTESWAGEVPGSAASAEAMRRFTAANGEVWDVEPSEVAIDRRDGSTQRCELLGTCLTGCSLDSIWYAADPVRKWAAEGLVTHLSGSVVDAVRELDGGVELDMTDGQTTERLYAPRVYLAAGAIGTGSLLVRSRIREQIVVRDTATAFAAAFQLRRRSDGSASHHGLSQWWVRGRDGKLLAQVYPPDPDHGQRLANRLPAIARSPALLGLLAAQLHPMIAYLGSDLSDSLRITADGRTTRVSGRLSSSTKSEFKSQLATLSRAFRKIGYLLPVSASSFLEPGAGYHFGASLPHFSGSDSLGRPHGLERIHIVDASVLPALEVGSITPTVMANALRIGRESSEELINA